MIHTVDFKRYVSACLANRIMNHDRDSIEVACYYMIAQYIFACAHELAQSSSFLSISCTFTPQQKRSLDK